MGFPDAHLTVVWLIVLTLDFFDSRWNLKEELNSKRRNVNKFIKTKLTAFENLNP